MTEAEVHLQTDERTTFVGLAEVDRLRGITTTRFRYDRSYLAGPGWSISPDLPVDGASAIVEGLPGSFEDAAPDSWGRNLIARRLARRWAGAGSPTPSELDFLLGVSDLTRQGALRFAVDGRFVASETEVPRLVDLGRLVEAADAVAREEADADGAVAALLDAGSGSLGGARPKASVRDDDGLLIAKFPHPDDRWDVIRWESVALELAEQCGIEVPDRRLVVIGSVPVVLVRRFDRRSEHRVPYLSARSLVGAGERVADYLEIVDAIEEHGSDVRRDLRRLWHRLAFSVAINNTDDHLRNHGFLRARGGWTLSPAFDLNPDPDPTALRQTSIAGETTAIGCRRALVDTSEAFGLEADVAERTWRDILERISTWREVASRHGLGSDPIERFANVFDRWSSD